MAVQLRVGKANMASVAQALGMSEATLRRRLLAEETSFSKLYEQARFDMAKRYLADKTLNLIDVANLMGFRTIPELAEVFGKWSDGVSPERYRQELGQPAGGVAKARPATRASDALPTTAAVPAEPTAAREPKESRSRDTSNEARESWV